ncbi:MAG: hypothetical protein GYB31_08065 [Bacteroidetes bacterium]|nr:hypothetical protein [Bacteroidota bacterium]
MRLCVLFGMLLHFGVSAQSPLSGFEHLGEEQGLTEEHNSFVFKDSRGFIWIGSYFGLYRFDGLEVKNFTPGPLEGQLPEQAVQSPFFEDGEGNVWFGTLSWLVCYNHKSGRFEKYRLIENGKELTDGYNIIHLERNKNLMYLLAGDRVYEYDLFSGEQTFLDKTDGARFGCKLDEPGSIQAFVSCKWMYGAGIDYFELIEADKKKKWVKTSNELLGQSISAAVLENDSVAWLAAGAKLLRFNLKQDSITGTYLPEGTERFSLFQISQVSDGNILCSAEGDGVFLFDTRTEEFKKITGSEKGTFFSKTSLLNDDEIFWMTTASKGVYYKRLIPKSNPGPQLPGLAASSGVSSIVEEKDTGSLLVGTDKFGLYRYERTASGTTLADVKKLPITSGDLMHSFLDSQNRVWAICRAAVYYSMDGGKSWIKVKEPSSLYFLHGLEAPSGEILVTSSAGIFKVVFTSGQPELKSHQTFEGFEGLQLTHLFSGLSGRIYIARNGREVLVCNANKPDIHIDQILKIDAQLFGVREVPGTRKAWLATSEGVKVVEYEIGVDSFVLRSAPAVFDPLIGVAVYSMVPDKRGDIWMTSNKGLWLYKTSEEKLLRFWKEDGLPGEQYSFFAAYYDDEKDEMWLGTSRGLHVFNPPDLKPYPFAPIPTILDLELPQGLYRGDTVIGEVAGIELPYHQNTLTFDIRAITNYLAVDSQVKYRLKGYDDNWVHVQNGGIARFTKIPPGTFHLEYQAISAGGIESDLRSLNILIKPPFYKTWWFKLLSVVVVLGTIFAVIRSILQRKLREKEVIIQRQAALQSERNRIAGELHDDLGGGLSVIRFLSDEMGVDESDQEKKEQIKRIASLSSGLVERMRDIIWALNTENDELDNLLRFLRRYAVSFLGDNKLECEFELPKDIPAVRINGERRRNVLLVFKEVLHNVVKHAQATKVRVQVDLNPDAFTITISDNGIGMSESPVRPDANGLQNIRKRVHPEGGAINWESVPDKGTTVYLTEPLQLIKDI